MQAIRREVATWCIDMVCTVSGISVDDRLAGGRTVLNFTGGGLLVFAVVAAAALFSLWIKLPKSGGTGGRLDR